MQRKLRYSKAGTQTFGKNAMKPFYHAKNSVKKYGGKIEDYQKVHDFFDSSKAHIPDMRHRCILHSSFGIFIVESVFGATLINSDGQKVCVRDVGEDHVIEDLGFIPTVTDYLKDLPMSDWIVGGRRHEAADKPRMKIHLTTEQMNELLSREKVD